ncbi:MAG: lysoplasmalogenase family protein [Pseudomonadota bacterium]
MTPLIAASGLGGLFALIYGAAYVGRPPSALRTVLKAASVAVLALGVWWSLPAADILIDPRAAPSDPLPVSAIVIGAVLACALGDAFLSGNGWALLLAGILAFALGQLGYILAMAAGFGSLEFPPIWFRAVVISVTSLGVVLLPRTIPILVRALMMVYGCILVVMAWFAFQTGNTLLIAGALLFVLSDLLIALQMSEKLPKKAQDFSGYGVWFTYWPAQALIVWGFSSVL